LLAVYLDQASGGRILWILGKDVSPCVVIVDNGLKQLVGYPGITLYVLAVISVRRCVECWECRVS
jgi:hypothetical protein